MDTTPEVNIFVHRIDVGCDPRDQAPDRIFVVESDVQPLQVAKDLGAHIEHRLLSGPLHEVRLRVFQQETESLQTDVERSDFGDSGHRVIAQKAAQRGAQPVHRCEVTVHRDLSQVGAENVSPGLYEDGNQSNSRLPFVGAQVGQQALHQAALMSYALPNTSSSLEAIGSNLTIPHRDVEGA